MTPPTAYNKAVVASPSLPSQGVVSLSRVSSSTTAIGTVMLQMA